MEATSFVKFWKNNSMHATRLFFLLLVAVIVFIFFLLITLPASTDGPPQLTLLLSSNNFNYVCNQTCGTCSTSQHDNSSSAADEIFHDEQIDCDALLDADKEDMALEIISKESVVLSKVAGLPMNHYSIGDKRILNEISPRYKKYGSAKQVQRYLFMGDDAVWRKGNSFLRHLLGDNRYAEKMKNVSQHESFEVQIEDVDGTQIAQYKFIWNPYMLPGKMKVGDVVR